MRLVDRPHRIETTAELPRYLVRPAGTTGRPPCFACGSTGWRALQHQGDPIPDMPGCFYGSTTYVVCGCRVVRLPSVSLSPL